MTNLQQLPIPFDQELWKDIKGFEGFYQVSNRGRVKSLSRIVVGGPNNSITKRIPETILKPADAKGYHKVKLSKDGVITQHKVHSLVGLHFCEGYFEGASVH